MELTLDRHYAHSPIVEVVCEFVFASERVWDLTYWGLIYEKLKAVFIERESLRGFSGELTTDVGGLQHRFNFEEVVRYSQPGNLSFVQVSPNQLSIHHLKPYPTWQVYRPLIQMALAAYAAVAGPGDIRRIGLRYINHIEIPSGELLSRFFNLYPHIGPGLPVGWSGFVAAIESPHGDARDRLRIQVGSIEAIDPATIKVALDLDYFLAVPLSVVLEDAMDWVEAAHSQIERAFEAAISDHTRSLFE
jgi:uncharacterized protein (TIGR04255 family)